MVPEPQQDLLSFQPTPSVPLRMDPMHRRVWIAGEPLYMGYNEFIFLSLLEIWYAQGEPCSRDLLCQIIYLDEVKLSDERDDRLDKLADRLRRKLKRIEGQPLEIKAVWGVGYELRFYPETSS
jgi:DNA-binding response OmpR family regulator